MSVKSRTRGGLARVVAAPGPARPGHSRPLVEPREHGVINNSAQKQRRYIFLPLEPELCEAQGQQVERFFFASKKVGSEMSRGFFEGSDADGFDPLFLGQRWTILLILYYTAVGYH